MNPFLKKTNPFLTPIKVNTDQYQSLSVPSPYTTMMTSTPPTLISSKITDSPSVPISTPITKQPQTVGNLYTAKTVGDMYKLKNDNIIPVPDRLKNSFKTVYDLNPDLPKGIMESIAMQESTMGKNLTNQKNDAGKYGYIFGITKSTFNDLLNRKSDPRVKEILSTIKDLKNPLATEQEALNFAAKYFKYKNTEYDSNSKIVGYMSDPIAGYWDNYNTVSENNTVDNKNKFATYLEHYKTQFGLDNELKNLLQPKTTGANSDSSMQFPLTETGEEKIKQFNTEQSKFFGDKNLPEISNSEAGKILALAIQKRKEIKETGKSNIEVTPDMEKEAFNTLNNFVMGFVGGGMENVGNKIDGKVTRELVDETKSISKIDSGFGAGQPSDIKGSSRYESTKSKGFDAYFNANYPKPISDADKLIAEGKIRVVSRNNRDVYQIKKGNEWVNTRDESSAVSQIQKSEMPKLTIELPQSIQEKQFAVEMKQEALDNSPFKNKNNKLLVDIEGRIRELGDQKNPALIKKIENRIAESGVTKDPTEFADGIENYFKQKDELNAMKVDLKSEIKAYKESIQEPNLTLATPKDIPLIAKSQGEVRSIEAQANQTLNNLDEPMREKVSSFLDMVKQSDTNVKQKVNILDYVRTPDRVLEKIGFGNEARILRQSYENYLKELPKNIDKITEWSKQVSKGSNERIFKYLDGQAITLNTEEKKVALEIKDWLADWAKRLKLPKDNTITNYITHIFDKELIAKEFDEDLAKIITDKLPGQIYDPFLLKRLGAKGYKQDTWAALDAYVKRATRKINMDKVLDLIKSKAGSSLDMSNIETSQWKYVQRYISGINLRPTEFDNLVDNTIKNIVGYKYGQRPVTYLTKLLRQMTFRGLLGLNPASALRNISQGVNTYSVLGEKYTALGYLKLFNKGAISELTEQGVLNTGFIQDRVLNSTKQAIQKMDNVLFSLFDTAEKINRGSAYFGAKAKALNEGKSLSESVDYAKSVVRKTQFSFGSIDTPVGLQSDIVKTLTQFQTYTIKQIEFLTEMAKDKNFIGLLRYAVGGLVFVYTLGKAFGMSPEQLIPNFRFETPPSLKFPVEAGKAILNSPDKYGRSINLPDKISNIINSSTGLIPAGSQIKKTIQGVQNMNQGGSYTKSGNLQFKQGQSIPEKLQSLLFGKYASKNAQNYYNNVGKKKTSTNPFLK